MVGRWRKEGRMQMRMPHACMHMCMHQARRQMHAWVWRTFLVDAQGGDDESGARRVARVERDDGEKQRLHTL